MRTSFFRPFYGLSEIFLGYVVQRNRHHPSFRGVWRRWDDPKPNGSLAANGYRNYHRQDADH
jgi:hypothetical protein